jgi:hypothetical protein
MEAYLINPVTRTARPKAGTIRRKKMALKRNKKGRFVKGSKAVKSRKASKSRKVRRTRKAATVTVVRAKHTVKRHRRAWTVKKHKAHKRKSSWMSNPPIIGDITSHLIMAGVLFGTLFAVGFVNKQAEKLPIPQGKFTPLLTKLGVALLAVWGVRQLSRRGLLRGENAIVAQAATFVPVAYAALATFAPAAAAQVNLAAELGGYLPQDLGMAMSPRGRLSDYTVSAELGAELEAESESGAF